MKLSKSLLPLCVFFTSSLFAEIYIVKKNDTLGEIIKSYFPDAKIFGKKGMMKKILAQNPRIKNADRIYVNQEIYFPEVTRPISLANENSKIEKEESIARLLSTEQNTTDHLRFKVLYGASFTSVNQSKTLTGFNIYTLSSNLLKVESEFRYDDYKLQAIYESHALTVSTENNSHTKRLSNLELQGIWKNLLFGFGYREIPVIKATTTSLELNKENQIGVELGHDKTWLLPTTKATSINLKSIFFIPLKSSSDRTDVMFSSISGFALKSQIEISREIIKRENYSLDFIWQNEFAYEVSSRQVSWGSNSGKVNASNAGISSLIGVAGRF